MSATESTAVIPPAPVAAPVAPPAPPAVTVEHISALHRRLDEIETWLGEKFKQLVALVEKAAAAAAPAIGASGAPVVATVEKVVDFLARCCGHPVSTHDLGCTADGCLCKKTKAGAASTGALAT